MMARFNFLLAFACLNLFLQDATCLTLIADGSADSESKPRQDAPRTQKKEENELDVNWPEFIASHDLQWSLKDMPTDWKESAFVGNGRLGAMVWMDASHGHHLRVEVGSSSLYDDRLPGKDLATVPDDAVCNRARLPLGRFLLKLDGPPTTFKMRLRLYDAEIWGSLGTAAGSVTFKIFASSDKNVLIIRTVSKGALSSEQDGPWTWQAANLTQMVQGCAAKRWKKTPGPIFVNGDSVALWKQTHLNGASHNLAFGYTKGHHGEKVLVVGASGVKPDDESLMEAVMPVKAAMMTDVDVLARDHQLWWHNYYPRGAFLSVGERTLESFYWVNIYKAASASRPGRPLYDLQGPWPVEGTPWPDVHWDLNIQLTYMPFAPAGRLDLLESLWEFLERNEANLINNVPPEWRSDSAAAPSLASGPDARASCNAKQWGGSIQRLASTCVVAPPSITGNLLWTLQVLHGAYETTLDPKYARRLYPLLRRAVNFHMHLQEEEFEDENGNKHLPASMSPEYGAPGRVPVQPDPNYDLALFRWGLSTVLKLCQGPAKELCEDEPNRLRWRNSLEWLAPYAEDKEEGYTIYRNQRLEESHRHFSHLLMFYPLRLTDVRKEHDRNLAQRSFDHWVGTVGRLQGYSFVASSAMSTMLDRPSASMGNLTHLLHKYISRNTFYSEGGPSRPVAETPMFAMTAIQELLLTHAAGEELRLFAGLDDHVDHASFHGLRAPGGVKVSAERRGGLTTFVVLEGATEGDIIPSSNKTRPFQVRPGFAAGANITVEKPPHVSVKVIEASQSKDGNAIVRVSGLARGARVKLWTSAAKPTFTVVSY